MSAVRFHHSRTPYQNHALMSHLTSFDALKPPYKRYSRVCASYNNTWDAKVNLERKITLAKYQHTLSSMMSRVCKV